MNALCHHSWKQTEIAAEHSKNKLWCCVPVSYFPNADLQYFTTLIFFLHVRLCEADKKAALLNLIQESMGKHRSTSSLHGKIPGHKKSKSKSLSTQVIAKAKTQSQARTQRVTFEDEKSLDPPHQSIRNSISEYFHKIGLNDLSREKSGISLLRLVQLELNLPTLSIARNQNATKAEREHHDNQSYEELINMFIIPWYLEKFMIFGLFVCINSFLALFTLAPIKIVLVMSQVIISYIKNPKQNFAYQLNSIKKDVVTLSLIALALFVLFSGKLDISKMYHDVRGQADIKLYVMFGVLEVAEKLCSSIGQDIINILFHISPLDQMGRFITFYLISVFYLSFHAYILIYQCVSLNVAANSYSNALLTLLLSNQFAELKSSVFKKLDREGLFQITMADLSERFQLSLMLAIIAVRNLLQLNSAHGLIPDSWKKWNIWLGAIFGPGVVVIGSEIFVDWLKHCFISKFNKIKPRVYRNFLYVSCLDFMQVFQTSSQSESGKSHEFTDFIVLTRRIGLPLLASAVCFLRMTIGDFKQIFIIQCSTNVRTVLASIVFFTTTIFTLLLIRIILVLLIFKIASRLVESHKARQKQVAKRVIHPSPIHTPVEKTPSPRQASTNAFDDSSFVSSPIELSYLPGSPNTEPSTINPTTRAHLYDLDEIVPDTPEEKRNKQLLNGSLQESPWGENDDEGLSKVMRYEMSSKRIW
ncbi:uncharacterized protein CPAR2_602910 [Candida parapsilosis]|uniref:Uncharacterized protein n=1 Tax=Candida parapsilosis (strain CDC 317 / ATCC MYA-4646) TaxID=578454 RepID=G8B5I0_CANPC|nr:uncharacterized protein CPAR2_602910 [Candida parapsilosis]CCE39872.1 hypothetical protein CPAR2_602910 [Candida parapsilosis]